MINAIIRILYIFFWVYSVCLIGFGFSLVIQYERSTPGQVIGSTHFYNFSWYDLFHCLYWDNWVYGLSPPYVCSGDGCKQQGLSHSSYLYNCRTHWHENIQLAGNLPNEASIILLGTFILCPLIYSMYFKKSNSGFFTWQ